MKLAIWVLAAIGALAILSYVGNIIVDLIFERRSRLERERNLHAHK